MEINTYMFNNLGLNEVKNEELGENWPVVYLLTNGKEIYIGETTSASKRMNDHLKNPQKNIFKKINIVFDSNYNKSVILDYEQKLIKYFESEDILNVTNKNSGQSSQHNYFNRDEYENKFADLWNELIKNKIAKKNIKSIENSNIFKYSPYNNLTPEQEEIRVGIINDICEILEGKKEGISLVNGCAGTGKTVLAISIINTIVNVENFDLSEIEIDDNTAPLVCSIKRLKKILNDMRNTNGNKLRIGFVFPMSGIRETIKKVFKKCGNGLNGDMVITPFALENNTYDIIFVDEAHRLKKRKNLPNGKLYNKFDNICNKLGIDKNTSNQLDWVVKRCKCAVIFYDENQSVTGSDISYNEFKNSLNSSNKNVTNWVLKSQIRCNGGNSYINYVSDIFDCQASTFQNIDNYEFYLYEDVKNMYDDIIQLNNTHELCRVVAGYSWEWKTEIKKKAPNKTLKKKRTSSKNSLDCYNQILADDKYDIKIEGNKFIWNLSTEDWISRKDSPYTIGCIHTTQGFDLNYVGVIFGEEIDYDPNQDAIVIDLDKFYDKKVKAGSPPDVVVTFILNAYKTMMFRGVKGCFVYACNENLRKYLKNFIKIK